jgi:DNA-binding MarR family transcriptional regulator
MPKQDLAAIAEHIDRDLRAIREILRRPLDVEIAKGDLTGPQQNAVAALVRSGGMTLKELSRHLGLAHSTVSGIVDRLVKRGIVERQVDPADRRLTRVVVTGAVREFVQKTMPRLAVHPLVEALRGTKPAEATLILDGLKTLRRVLERESN